MKTIGRTPKEIITELLSHIDDNTGRCHIKCSECECRNTCRHANYLYDEKICYILEDLVENIKTTDKMYESEDGEIFDNPEDCQAWEKYHSFSLKELCAPYFSKITFDEDGIDTKSFTYAIKIANIPEDLERYIRLYIDKRKNYFISYVPFEDIRNNEPTLFFNDWSDSCAGRCGSNGWVRIGAIDELQSKIKDAEKHLKEFE